MAQFRCLYQGLISKTAGSRRLSTRRPPSFCLIELLGHIGRDPNRISTYGDKTVVLFPVVTWSMNKFHDPKTGLPTSKKRLTWHQARVSKPSIQDLVMDTMKVGSLVYLTGSLISPASVSKVDAYNPIVMIDYVCLLSQDSDVEFTNKGKLGIESKGGDRKTGDDRLVEEDGKSEEGEKAEEESMVSVAEQGRKESEAEQGHMESKAEQGRMESEAEHGGMESEAEQGCNESESTRNELQ